MKKIFIIALVAFVAGCNSKQTNNESATSETAPSSQMKDISSPYPIGYSSKFVMDDPKNAETLLNLWKAWDDADLSKAKDYFADTVELYFANGMTLKGPRDSIIAGAQKERATLQSVSSRVDAIMALKSTDKNEHWAAIWGSDKSTKDGKTDSSYVQETWRFDSTGKANLMFQFRRSATPPAMPKK